MNLKTVDNCLMQQVRCLLVKSDGMVNQGQLRTFYT